MLKYPVLNVSNDYELDKLLSKLNLTSSQLIEFYQITENKSKSLKESREDLLVLMAESGNDNYRVMSDQLEKDHNDRSLKVNDEKSNEPKKDPELDTLISSAEDILSKASSREVLEKLYNTLKGRQSLNPEQQQEIEELLMKLENKMKSTIVETPMNDRQFNRLKVGDKVKFDKKYTMLPRPDKYDTVVDKDDKSVRTEIRYNDGKSRSKINWKKKDFMDNYSTVKETYDDYDDDNVNKMINDLDEQNKKFANEGSKRFIDVVGNHLERIGKNWSDITWIGDIVNLLGMNECEEILKELQVSECVSEEFKGYPDDEPFIFEVGDKVIFNKNGEDGKGVVSKKASNDRYWIEAEDGTNYLLDAFDMKLDNQVDEDATAGATTAGNVATIPSRIGQTKKRKPLSKDLGLFKEYVEKGIPCSCSNGNDKFKYDIQEGKNILYKNGTLVKTYSKNDIIECACYGKELDLLEGYSFPEMKLLMEDTSLVSQTFRLPDDKNLKFSDGVIIPKGSEIVILDTIGDEYTIGWEDNEKTISKKVLKTILNGCEGVSTLLPLVEDADGMIEPENPEEKLTPEEEVDLEQKIKDNMNIDSAASIENGEEIKDNQTIIGYDDVDSNDKKVFVQDGDTKEVRAVRNSQIKFKEQ